MNSKIWLSSPHMSGNELKYVNEAFDTNWVAPLGPNVNQFEKELASYVGSGHCAALSSGTSAIHLALIMLGVGVGVGEPFGVGVGKGVGEDVGLGNTVGVTPP